MKYSQAFSYVFEDSNWFKKIAIAGLITLIPIVGQLYLLGWMIEIIRRVKAGREDILPTTHFGYFLTLGLKAFVVALVYSIPVILANIFVRSNMTAAVSGDPEHTVTYFFAGMSFFGSFISLLLNIISGLGSIYGFVRLAETDEISAAINVVNAWNTFKANWQAYAIVFLLEIVTALIGAAGGVICIGVILTIPYATAVNGHLLGQLSKNAVTPSAKQRAPRNDAPVDDTIEQAPLKTVKADAPVESKVEETAAAAGEVIEGTFKQIHDEASDKAEEIHEAVEDKAEEIHDAVEDKAEEIHDAVEDKAEEVKKDVDDKLDDLKDF